MTVGGKEQWLGACYTAAKCDIAYPTRPSNGAKITGFSSSAPDGLAITPQGAENNYFI